VDALPKDGDDTVWNLTLVWCDDRYETHAFKNWFFRSIQMFFYKKRYQGRHYLLGSCIKRLFTENGAIEQNIL
jgi:hypothetical protein